MNTKSTPAASQATFRQALEDAIALAESTGKTAYVIAVPDLTWTAEVEDTCGNISDRPTLEVTPEGLIQPAGFDDEPPSSAPD